METNGLMQIQCFSDDNTSAHANPRPSDGRKGKWERGEMSVIFFT